MALTTELAQKRATLIKNAQEFHTTNSSDDAPMSDDHTATWNRMWLEIENIDKRETEQIRKDELDKMVDGLAESTRTNVPAADSGQTDTEKRDDAWIDKVLEQVHRDSERTMPELVQERKDVGAYFKRGEYRALQVDSAEAGGYVVMPEQFIRRLIQAADDAVWMRRLGTVLPPLRDAMGAGIPSLDADPADADWTSEIATGTRDTTMDFGKRVLTPHPLGKEILVSNTLLRQGAIDVEALVRDRLTYKFSVTEEKGFLTGTGAGQPLGIFTATSDGISTGRDVVTGSTTNYTYDGLKNTEYSLKGQYRSVARWLFHRDGIKLIAQLKDDQSRPLLQPAIRASDPDTLFGYPMLDSEFTPNTFTTGLYVGMFADFKFFWIVDSLQMTIQRLAELYAKTNQVGFIARKETDGMPVLEEAFARMITS